MIMKPIDISTLVHEIIEILHKHKIPLASVEMVLKSVMDDIQANTIPYNPNGGFDENSPYQVQCSHCGQRTSFYLTPTAVNNGDLPDDLKESPVYFAKKCESSN